MGACQANDNRLIKVLLLEKHYPQFHLRNFSEDKILSYLKENEQEVWEYYNKFNQNKEELKKTNIELYKLFFDEKNKKDDTLTISGLKSDDDERLYFFFNRRKYQKVVITKSNIIFPRFCYLPFPVFRAEKSFLTSISITSSKVMLDDQSLCYAHIENVVHLDLSFNEIEQLPESFCKLINLKVLYLRRNLLKALPKAFEELKMLEELDLSENRFKALPKEIFAHSDKLQKLNMNANQLETFEFVGMAENSELQYLFLAQNKLKKIPMDIKKFKNIKYVNLDENEIFEVDPNLNEEIQYDLEITLYNNKKNFEPIILKKPQSNEQASGPLGRLESMKTMTQKGTDVQKSKAKMSTTSLGSVNASKVPPVNKSISTTKIKNEMKDPDYDYLKVKNPQTQIEKDINAKVNELMTKKLAENKEKNQIINEVMEEKYYFMINQLENLINAGRERELSLIDDFEHKVLFKKCYSTYLTKEEYDNTGVLNPKLEEMEPLERKYFLKNVLNIKNKSDNKEIQESLAKQKEKGKVQQREDISNLIFLKQLNQLIASNKVKMFLQYLGNIDLKIRGFLINLWESRDNNSFILILTELKLFLKEMIDYYDEKKVTGFDLTYEVEKSQSKSVIHDIFFNDITLKVLYRLGLSDKRTVVIKGIEQEKFKFAINQIMNNKHRLFENFLSRFINIIKGTKVDPLDLEV